jgi:hypothetical protein
LLSKTLLAIAVLAGGALAGPVEFGSSELDRAIAERRINPRLLRIKTEVAADPPESYRIVHGLITGGDLRGLMYGLLEAARQIRATGRLRIAHGAPSLAIRGVRLWLKDLDPERFRSREFWPPLFQTLARNRFNRFNLVLPGPPVDVESLRFISQTAADYGVDFTLGLWDDLEGQTGSEMGEALAKPLSACPSIRNVQSGLDPDAAMYVARALHDSGRRVTLEAAAGMPAVAAAAAGAGVPFQTWVTCPDGARPEGRRPFYCEVPHPPRDPRAIGVILTRLAEMGSAGFEIDMPAGADAADSSAPVPVPYLAWGLLGYGAAAK